MGVDYPDDDDDEDDDAGALTAPTWTVWRSHWSIRSLFFKAVDIQDNIFTQISGASGGC